MAKRYDKEFQLGAARLVVEQRYSRAEELKALRKENKRLQLENEI